MTGSWRKSTASVNKFVVETTNFKRIKIGTKSAVEFIFKGRRYLLTDDGDLFVYEYAERLTQIPTIHPTRKGKITSYFRFRADQGYWSKKHKDLVAKDFMWAAFGNCDLPEKHCVTFVDGNQHRICMSNLNIRRK